MPQALIVDDDRNFSMGLAEIITNEGFAARTAATLKEAREELNKSLPDVILLDMKLPDGSGMDFLREIAGFPATEVVVVTGNGSVDSAVEALQSGASHYLTKPLNIPRVRALLASLSQSLELKEQLGTLRGELRQLGRFGPMVGASPAMQTVYDLIGRVSQTDATVFLVGETGTGKELAAETVHQLSRRRKEPFLVVNCGAVSPHLIGSELFGHEKGSFTGAQKQHRGYFERANKGTLFLDEIAGMPLDLQMELLRVLETHTFMRIGGDQPVASNVRVIAASNKPPREAVEQGKLREDLFYRLDVFPIQLPPLRARMEDVELLAEHMLRSLNSEAGTSKKFTRRAIQHLCAHTWPGNVRELRNTVQRAFILGDDEIDLDAFPAGLGGKPSGMTDVSVGASLADAERRLILATLEYCKGDKKEAAAILGISVKSVYNRLNEYKAEE